LEPVTDVYQALNESTRRVHADRSNVLFHKEYSTDGFDEAFHAAPHRLQETFTLHRQTAVSMETRGLAAMTDPASGRLTVYASHQNPHGLRELLAQFLDMPLNQLRVIVPEVGGAFGMKAALYPEYLVVAYMAQKLHKPLKWISDRMESLMTDVHARDALHEVEFAFDGDGRLIALRDHMMANAGAYAAIPFCGAIGETVMASDVLTGPYRIPHLSTTIDVTFSNKTPLGAYRGVWGPIASFIQEGVVERVAAFLKKDPVEIRRINMIQDSDFPYKNAAGLIYDAGSYGESMEKALQLAEYEPFRKKQEEARKNGRYLGLGISVFVEPSAMAESEAGGVTYETASIRVESNGTVTASLGTGPSGQGHATTFAQIIADELGVDVSQVVVLFGDTDSAPYGGGTGGSRSGTMGGGAATKAGEKMREKLAKLAAHLLEAAEEDITLEDGKAFVAGVPSKSYTIAELAKIAYTEVSKLPEGMEPGLETVARYQPTLPVTFSNGTHIATVEVDINTGFVNVLNYTVVNDCGNLINPMIVEGQIHGGIAQGIGSALLEELKYDENGQLTTTQFMDYLMPGMTDVPRMKIEHIETPSEHIGGFKGMGEGSLIASPAAVVNAISDALSPFRANVNAMPVTPDKVLQWVSKSSANRA
jgi:carbon-monoxide dehydrogenase large subunit